ncbi:MAG: hypothetical protein ACE5HO_15905 [bacterium]
MSEDNARGKNALSRREKWTLWAILLSSLGLGIAVGVAPEPVQALVYRVGGVIVLPLVTLRVAATALIHLKKKNFLTGALWLLVAIMFGVLALFALAQLVTFLQQ